MSTGTNSERILANNAIIRDNNDDLSALKTRINNLPTSGDTTATVSDILLNKTAVSKGVKITGTLGTETKTVKSTTSSQTVTPTSGKLISEITVSPIDLETKTVTPTTSQQTINPTSGKDGISQITVNAINLQSKSVEITENGTTTISPDTGYDGLSGVEVTTNVSGGAGVPAKDVNFFDYDGTIVYSYTKAEFLALTELPENPSHEGLTAQGWNWTLSDAKTYVTDYDGLDIGQMYITDDGKTRIYITLEEKQLNPTINFNPTGTATIDWGDNSENDTLTGTSYSTTKSISHQYASSGDYVITIDGGGIYIYGNQSYGCKLLAGPNGDNRGYITCIRKIETGNNITLYDFAFNNCYNLQSITLHRTMGQLVTGFTNCTSLKGIVVPIDTIKMNGSSMAGCSMLSRVSLPRGITTYGKIFDNCVSLTRIFIPNNFANVPGFLNCYNLANVVIPSGVSSVYANGTGFSGCYSLRQVKFLGTAPEITTNAFANCYSVMLYDFSSVTNIPALSNTNAFSGINPNCKIVVPDSLYTNWIAANNWSTYASYIVKASEYFT